MFVPLSTTLLKQPAESLRLAEAVGESEAEVGDYALVFRLFLSFLLVKVLVLVFQDVEEKGRKSGFLCQ